MIGVGLQNAICLEKSMWIKMVSSFTTSSTVPNCKKTKQKTISLIFCSVCICYCSYWFNFQNVIYRLSKLCDFFLFLKEAEKLQSDIISFSFSANKSHSTAATHPTLSISMEIFQAATLLHAASAHQFE